MKLIIELGTPGHTNENPGNKTQAAGPMTQDLRTKTQGPTT